MKNACKNRGYPWARSFIPCPEPQQNETDYCLHVTIVVKINERLETMMTAYHWKIQNCECFMTIQNFHFDCPHWLAHGKYIQESRLQNFLILQSIRKKPESKTHKKQQDGHRS